MLLELTFMFFLDEGIWMSQPLYRNDISSHYYKSHLRSKWETDYKHSLLLNSHPFFVKISIAVDSIARQAVDIVSLSSSFCSSIHVLARYVALKRIRKHVCFWDLWKTISFLLSQIGQQRAHKPAKTFFFVPTASHSTKTQTYEQC